MSSVTVIPAWWRGRSPAFRLAVAYTGLIALLGLIFSLVLYQFADAQIVDGLRRQYFDLHRSEPGAMALGRPPLDRDTALAAIQPLVNDARRAIILRLVYFNLAITTLGSLLSYWLAKRTLRPIEQALEAQSRFTADASHELRTPLAVMRTEIETARADARLTEDQAFALLGSNLEEVSRLHALVDSLLRLARSNQQLRPLSPTSTNKVATEAIQRVAARAKLAGIQIINDVRDFSVQADQSSLAELLVILLDNAIKYSQAGTVVRVSSERHNHTGELSVIDQGRGIAPADLPHIFDRFYRADAARTKADVEGHGLGLSIARQIAELHGARLIVKSQPGQGSTFTVTLKLP